MKVYDAWLEVKLDNLRYNAKLVKNTLNGEKILCMVKAGGYGHGFMEVAKVLVEEKYDYLGIDSSADAIELREAFPDVNILKSSHSFEEDFADMINYEIEQIVASYREAKLINDIAKDLGKIAKVHINIDTGMGRTGFFPREEDFREILKISKLESIKIAGTMTHLSSGELEDDDYSLAQIEKFKKSISRLRELGVDCGIVHAANSPTISRYKHARFDMVRAGMVVYGQVPDFCPEWAEAGLKPTMNLKAKIANIRTVPKDSYIGYDRTYKTDKETRIATLNIGYYNGLYQNIDKNFKVSVNGKRAEIIGIICMNNCMLDVSDIDCKIGDEVMLFGKNDKDEIYIRELAKAFGMTEGEFVVHLGKCVPKIYDI